MIRARLWVIVAVIVITAGIASQIPRLHADFTPSDLFAAFGDSRQVAEDFRSEFGNTDNVVLFLYEEENMMKPESIGLLYRLTERVREVEGVAGVQSVVSLPRPSATVLARLDGGSQGNAPEEVDGVEDSITDSLFSLYDALSGIALFGGEDSESAAEEAHANDASRDSVAQTDAAGRFQPIVRSADVSEEDAQLLDRVVGLSRAVDGRLVSKDRSVATVVVTLEPELTKNDDLSRMVTRFEDVLAEFAQTDPDAKLSLGGLPYIRTSIVRNMGADQKVLLPASIIVSLLILLLAFRWLPALVLPTIAVGVSALVLVGGMAIFGENLNILNNIIPTLVIIIGISNSIHIINRYRDNIGNGKPQFFAASDSMQTMLLACFLTSATTAIGFASLAVSKTEILRRFGWTAGAGVMIAYLATIFLVPPALAIVKPMKADTVPSEDGADGGRFDSAIARLARLLIRFRWTVVLVSAALIALTLALGMKTKIDSAVLDQVSPSDDVYRTTRLVEAKLGGIRPLEVYVRSEEPWGTIEPAVVERLNEIVALASEQEGVLTTLGYADLLGQVQVMLSGDLDAADRALDDPDQVRGLVRLLSGNAQNPLGAWLINDGRSARIQIMVEDMGALKTNVLLDLLEARIAERFADIEGVSVRLTGDAYIGSRGLDAVISDLTGSLATAVIIIFVIMVLLFRSLRLGIVSIPPALMPLSFTLFWMWVRGMPLNTATAIIFSIAIGLTVDGCIHIVSRFREEYKGETALDDAIVASVRGTGKAIVFTALALIVGFGVMLISNFVPVRRFGELLAFTIFIMLIATIGTLPSLLHIVYGGVEKKRLRDAAK